MAHGARIVVTGATGFLGAAVARRLRADNAGAAILGLGRDASKGELLHADGVEFKAVDLVDADSVSATLEGADAVVHCAALSSPWGPAAAFHAANVTATENVARACVAAGVPRLVHISSPGMYHDGRPHRGIREDHPLPGRAVNHYAASKRLAEERVREITRDTGVRTIILRPRAIFGPGDTSLLPRIAAALRSGRLPRIGDGNCVVDMTYIENAVDAVLLALDVDTPPDAPAYNISNGEPVRIWNVIDRLAAAIGAPPVQRHVPAPVARAVASALEAAHRVFMPDREPALLRYGVELLSVDMTLDISAARAELGYVPRVDMDTALARTFAALSSADASR